MRFLNQYLKSMKYSHIGAMLVTALLVFMVVPSILGTGAKRKELYALFLNGERVATVTDSAMAERLIREARKELARETDGLLFLTVDPVLSAEAQRLPEEEEEVAIERISKVLCANLPELKKPVYEVKINEFTVNLSDSDEVLALLQEAKMKYDENDEYTVQMELDPTRELNVLTSKIVKTETLDADASKDAYLKSGGGIARIEQFYDEARTAALRGFDFGIKEMDFGENVEVVQVYVDPERVSTLEEAVELVTKKEEKDTIYEVEPGDSLSVIAEKNKTTLANLIAMNKETIPNQNATIRVGDMIRVTVPQPELSVVRTEEIYYEENYDAEAIYIDNDTWYSNRSEVKQEPVAGFRKVVADILYRNDLEEGRNVVYENIIAEAIPKIIERGTQPPPTYLKPISGGRLSSRFGKRKAPTKGASTYHKGVDWATPIGTSIVASSDGTVVRAGWGGGYGYCIYIEHPDGKVTRYGHLSKILVKSGQTVRQSEKIGLSGNTGVSSGPHIHFEILVNGKQVNPLDYL